MFENEAGVTIRDRTLYQKIVNPEFTVESQEVDENDTLLRVELSMDGDREVWERVLGTVE